MLSILQAVHPDWPNIRQIPNIRMQHVENASNKDLTEWKLDKSKNIWFYIFIYICVDCFLVFRRFADIYLFLYSVHEPIILFIEIETTCIWIQKLYFFTFVLRIWGATSKVIIFPCESYPHIWLFTYLKEPMTLKAEKCRYNVLNWTRRGIICKCAVNARTPTLPVSTWTRRPTPSAPLFTRLILNKLICLLAGLLVDWLIERVIDWMDYDVDVDWLTDLVRWSVCRVSLCMADALSNAWLIFMMLGLVDWLMLGWLIDAWLTDWCLVDWLMFGWLIDAWFND